jgi:uncharacterized membrane protein (DUF106 family)
MQFVHNIIGAGVDFPLQELHAVPPLWPLSLFAILAGVFMLFVFRYTSNQAGIKRAKDRIKAHLLELRLFKDDLGVIFSSQKHILQYNAIYIGHAVKPMLVMIVPMALLLIQLDSWFGHRPLQPGETAIVTAQVRPSARALLDQVALKADPGLVVETPPLRMPATGQVAWRIRAQESGVYHLPIDIGGHKVSKSVVVADTLARLSPRRAGTRFWDLVLNAGEQPLPENTALASIEVQYPTRSIALFGWDLHWLVVFFVFSMVSGFALKGILRVEI